MREIMREVVREEKLQLLNLLKTLLKTPIISKQETTTPNKLPIILIHLTINLFNLVLFKVLLLLFTL